MNAIRKIRLAMQPGVAVSNECRIIHLHAPSARKVLSCRWRQEPDGRLACTWDFMVAPPRLLDAAVTVGDEDRS